MLDESCTDLSPKQVDSVEHSIERVEIHKPFVKESGREYNYINIASTGIREEVHSPNEFWSILLRILILFCRILSMKKMSDLIL